LGLRDLDLKPAYDSDEDDILNDFYIPALSESIRYSRLAGFFSSTALAIAARGICSFILKGGQMELIIGARLSKRDVDAIKAGILEPNRVIAETVIKDLENISEEFVGQMRLAADECFRILSPGCHCAILMGDTRRHKHYIPIHIGVLSVFLDAGFILREDIIKLQHKTKSARERWRSHQLDFYKIAHEHLYVLRKPNSGEKLSQFKYSRRWWPVS